MSRRFPRIRTQLTATVTLEETGNVLVCRTRDISHRGCFLDTAQLIQPGARVAIAIMDAQRGEAMEVDGEVTRCLTPGPDGLGRGVGVRFDQPPAAWDDLVAHHQKASPPSRRRPQRLRVLVVGDRDQQRGAMALYVTSGWDIRFATDLAGAEDALHGVTLNAVIVESDPGDDHCRQVLHAARRLQSAARRIVRADLGEDTATSAGDPADLYHRLVDRHAGLDALLDALTADIGTG